IEQRVEIRERQAAARAGICPRRRADHADSAALEERVRLLLGQRQATLQKDERRPQRLGPFVDAIVTEERALMALPEEDGLLGQEAAQLGAAVRFAANDRGGVQAGVTHL